MYQARPVPTWLNPKGFSPGPQQAPQPHFIFLSLRARPVKSATPPHNGNSVPNSRALKDMETEIMACTVAKVFIDHAQNKGLQLHVNGGVQVKAQLYLRRLLAHLFLLNDSKLMWVQFTSTHFLTACDLEVKLGTFRHIPHHW